MVGTNILGLAASNMVSVLIFVERRAFFNSGGVDVIVLGLVGRRVLCFRFSHNEFDLRTNFRRKGWVSEWDILVLAFPKHVFSISLLKYLAMVARGPGSWNCLPGARGPKNAVKPVGSLIRP